MVLAALVALCVTGAAAAGGKLTAGLSRTRVSVGETFELTVTYSGSASASFPAPRLPETPGLETIGTSQSSSFSFIGGRMSADKSFIYTILASRAGRYTLPSIEARVHGEKLRTDPLTVEVVPLAPPPGPSPSVTPRTGRAPSRRAAPPPSPRGSGDSPLYFVRPETDRKKVYVGEEFEIRFMAYSQVRFVDWGFAEGYSVEIPGVLAEGLDQPQRLSLASRQIDGKPFLAARLFSAIVSPIASGTVEIPAKEFKLALVTPRRNRRRNMLNDPFFDDFFRRNAQRIVTVRSAPLTIEALPLPTEGRPPDFSGLVGRFTLRAQPDRLILKAGERLSVRARLEGRGSLSSVGEPEWDLPEGLEKYPSTSDLSKARLPSGEVAAAKNYDFLVIPRKEGVYDVPPMRVSYFDPVEKRYKIASTKPFRIKVKPGLAQPERGSEPESITPSKREPRFIKPNVRSLPDLGKDPFGGPAWWLAQIPALALLVGAWFYGRLRDRLDRDRGFARSRGAHKMARRRLGTARKALEAGEIGTAYAEVSSALSGYLADRVNLSAAGLTRERVLGELERLGAPEEQARGMLAVLDECDRMRFAPESGGRGGAERTVRRAEEIIVALEKSGR